MSGLRCSVAALFLLGTQAQAGPPAPGVSNFHQVDERVYRGAQPTGTGFSYLAKIGVKTVVDLRENGQRSRREDALVTSLGMHYVHVPMSGLAPPSNADITRILVLMEDGASGTVFVHCLRGADRTGAVIAAYRIDHDHWDNYRAWKEAMSLGMSFFQLPRQNFIRKFQPLPTVEAHQSPVAYRAPENSSQVSLSPAAANPR